MSTTSKEERAAARQVESARREAFVSHYLGDKLFNATASAIAAGYSPATAAQQGSRLLKSAAVAKIVKARLALLQMESDEVIVGLTAQARSSMAAFVDDEGNFDFDTDAARAAWKFVKKRKHKVKKYSGENSSSSETEIELELVDTQRAYELLGKIRKLFVTIHDVDKDSEGLSVLREALSKLRAPSEASS